MATIISIQHGCVDSSKCSHIPTHVVILLIVTMMNLSS